jgi:hypothetical protein
MVNDQHTKVGKTRDSFEKRAREYRKTFNQEVQFFPLVEVPLGYLDAVESAVLFQMGRRYARVGRAAEWFDTTDREVIAQLVCEVAGETMSALRAAGAPPPTGP